MSILAALAIRPPVAAIPIFAEPEKQNCLALLAFVSLLWATEALPLYVTSMLVPLLTVVLRVLVDGQQSPPHRLSPQEAAPRIFHAMFSQVRFRVLGSRIPHSRGIPSLIQKGYGKTVRRHIECALLITY